MNTTLINFSEHPFWKFSLAIYEYASVKEICLSLQNEHQMNVNLLLFCCWTADSGIGQLTREQLLSAMQSIRKWHTEVTTRLRDMRNYLHKRNKPKLRKTILNIEMLAEKIEQLSLSDQVANCLQATKTIQDRLADAKTNLITYTKLLNRPFTHAQQELLSKLLAAVFHEART